MPPSQAKVSPIEVVVFDLGGVLVDWNPSYLYRRLFNDDAAMERFLSEVCSPEWNERRDAGRPWYQALAELTARYPDQAAMILAGNAGWRHARNGGTAKRTKNASGRVPRVRHSFRHAFSNRITGITLVDCRPGVSFRAIS